MALMFQHIRFQADSTCNVMLANSCCRLQKGESIPKHTHNFNPYSTSLYLSRYPFSLCNHSVPDLQLTASESHLSYPESHCRMPDLHLALPEWHLAASDLHLAGSELHLAGSELQVTRTDWQVTVAEWQVIPSVIIKQPKKCFIILLWLMPLLQTNSINETNLSRLDGSRNWAILFVQTVLHPRNLSL